MRVISGTLKGRNIEGFNIEGTRPTMDRVKESLFAMIQEKVKAATILDLFAGSGNLGIEAISNGAKLCYFNDINKECIKAIKKNITSFKIEDKSVVLNYNYMDVLKYLNNNKIKLDIIFLDPPYKKECLNEAIKYLVDNRLLNKEALIICEIDSNYLEEFDLEVIKNKKYGDKYILIFKNNI